MSKDVNRELCRSCLDVKECKFKGKFIKDERVGKLSYCTNRNERL